MGMEWYDMIALRNGGYKNNATYTVEGVSGEEIFDEAMIYFPNEHEFTKYISSVPGSPDYSLPVQTKIKESRLALKQWRYIWKAVKP